MGCVRVEIRGPKQDVEAVAEYLRQARRVRDERADRPVRGKPGEVVRVMEVACDEKQNPVRLAR